MKHLSAEDLAAYLDRSLPPDARRAAEEHLADCPECRADMLGTRRVLAESRASSSRIRLIAPVAAAAVLAALILLPGDGVDTTPRIRNDGMRPAGTQQSLVDIPVREVEVGTGVDSGRVTLTWETVGPGLDYRITVTDRSGEAVWTGTSTQPRVTLPADATEGLDSIYFWFVDATLANGEAATSGIQEFVIR